MTKLDTDVASFFSTRRELAKQILKLRGALRMAFGGDSTQNLYGVEKKANGRQAIQSPIKIEVDVSSHEAMTQELISVLVKKINPTEADHAKAQKVLFSHNVVWDNFCVAVVPQEPPQKLTNKQRAAAMARGSKRARNTPCLVTKAIIDGGRRFRLAVDFTPSRTKCFCQICGADRIRKQSNRYPSICSTCVDRIENNGMVPHDFSDQWKIRLPSFSASHRRTTNPMEDAGGIFDNIVRLIEGE